MWACSWQDVGLSQPSKRKHITTVCCFHGSLLGASWGFGVQFAWLVMPVMTLMRMQGKTPCYSINQVGTMWLKDRWLLTPSAFVSYFLSATERCPQKPEMEKKFHCEVLWWWLFGGWERFDYHSTGVGVGPCFYALTSLDFFFFPI